MKPDRAPHRLVAVLGPTNTGKTHYAMDRMLAHDSGMIGFPLRLLARENYDRAVAVKGAARVALITGEEKIVPAGARYFICTVESMPVDRRVAFLGIDEIQMCADPDRGHVFTERLLHARGLSETMFMGAATMRAVIRALLIDVEFISRPRFSKLSYSGSKKTSRLPARSAVVGFSAADVYAIAELIRRQRGGAAVVMGALSPRTRNAQVAMYQNGEVDYLVATDAIGMGLNMDVDHVAFAATRKFDGRSSRALVPAELAQIAGRAGRHMNDGSFGVTGGLAGLDEETVGRIENHQFKPLSRLFWRNSELDLSSLDGLTAGLAARPKRPGLIRAREADDERALAQLAADPEITALAAAGFAPLLWDVCQIPDFQKLMTDPHARMLSTIFKHLSSANGRLPEDWLAAQVSRLENTDGDIETLTQRIAGIRTWTYVSFRGDWLDDATHWRERTRAVEDKLSDALHERLTRRFVDKRTALLFSRLKERQELLAAVRENGDVLVEGHFVGRLDGFGFIPDAVAAADATARKTMLRAAGQALRGEIEARIGDFAAAPDEAFRLTDEGGILWRDAVVAGLRAGPQPLRPVVEPLSSDLLDAPLREVLARRLDLWMSQHLRRRLAPLFLIAEHPVSGAARGILFRLGENLGSMPRDLARAEIDALGKADRLTLRQAGVCIGRHSIYLPALLKPAAVGLRGLLWGLAAKAIFPLPIPSPGRMSVAADAAAPMAFWQAIGYRRLGPRAVRVDIVERLAARAWALSAAAPFTPPPELMNLLGCGAEELVEVLEHLGYQGQTIDGQRRLRRRRKARPKTKGRPRQAPAVRGDPDSPFAKLAELSVGG